MIANHIPRRERERERSTGSDWGDVTQTHLVLLFPVDNIIDPAKTAYIDVFTWPDQHIRGGDDEC